MAGLLIAAIVFGTVLVAELPDNSGLASLVLGTRYRAGGVVAGAFAAFAVHVVLAVTCGSLLPHRIVQIAVAVVFLAGAVLVLRGDKDDDEVRLKADAAGFWAVAATSFGVILLAELGDFDQDSGTWSSPESITEADQVSCPNCGCVQPPGASECASCDDPMPDATSGSGWDPLPDPRGERC